MAGAAFSQTLIGGGRHGPYNWAIASGSLPAGLKLNATTGAIVGTGLQGQAAITLDQHGHTVTMSAPGTSGNAFPKATLGGSSTMLSFPTGIDVDT